MPFGAIGYPSFPPEMSPEDIQEFMNDPDNQAKLKVEFFYNANHIHCKGAFDSAMSMINQQMQMNGMPAGNMINFQMMPPPVHPMHPIPPIPSESPPISDNANKKSLKLPGKYPS